MPNRETRMCATDLLVEGEITPPNKPPENTVVIPPEIMRAFELHNEQRVNHDLDPVTLEDFVVTGLSTHLIRIWPGIMNKESS